MDFYQSLIVFETVDEICFNAYPINILFKRERLTERWGEQARARRGEDKLLSCGAALSLNAKFTFRKLLRNNNPEISREPY